MLIFKEKIFNWYEICQICHGSVCLKEFSKNLFMFVRPIIKQKKKTALLVITLDTRRYRHAVRVL